MGRNIVYAPNEPKSVIEFPDKNGIKKEEKTIIPVVNNNNLIVKKSKKEYKIWNKPLNEKQSEVSTNTIIFGINCTGTTLGLTSMLLGFGLKGLTINQSKILEYIGAGLFSFCAVKCVKCLVRIGCPLDGKPPLVDDDEEIVLENDNESKSIIEESPMKLEMKR